MYMLHLQMHCFLCDHNTQTCCSLPPCYILWADKYRRLTSWQVNSKTEIVYCVWMSWVGAFVPHLYYAKPSVSSSAHSKSAYDADLTVKSVDAESYLIAFWCLRFACFVFLRSALYSERLKQWGYWFILCLHQIPFTFEMLFARKTKSQLLCPNKA